MVDAATVEMLKPGKNKGFVKSIPDKLLIFKLIQNNKKILSQIWSNYFSFFFGKVFNKMLIIVEISLKNYFKVFHILIKKEFIILN